MTLDLTTPATPLEQALSEVTNTWMPHVGHAVHAIARLVADKGAGVLHERNDILADAAGIDMEADTLGGYSGAVDNEDIDLAREAIQQIARGAWIDEDDIHDSVHGAMIGCYSTDNLAPRGITWEAWCSAYDGDIVKAACAIVRADEYRCGRLTAA